MKNCGAEPARRLQQNNSGPRFFAFWQNSTAKFESERANPGLGWKKTAACPAPDQYNSASCKPSLSALFKLEKSDQDRRLYHAASPGQSAEERNKPAMCILAVRVIA
jgi:hypothetical protein